MHFLSVLLYIEFCPILCAALGGIQVGTELGKLAALGAKTEAFLKNVVSVMPKPPQVHFFI